MHSTTQGDDSQFESRLPQGLSWIYCFSEEGIFASHVLGRKIYYIISGLIFGGYGLSALLYYLSPFPKEIAGIALLGALIATVCIPFIAKFRRRELLEKRLGVQELIRTGLLVRSVKWQEITNAELQRSSHTLRLKWGAGKLDRHVVEMRFDESLQPSLELLLSRMLGTDGRLSVTSE